MRKLELIVGVNRKKEKANQAIEEGKSDKIAPKQSNKLDAIKSDKIAEIKRSENKPKTISRNRFLIALAGHYK